MDAKTPTYTAWVLMKRRCYNAKTRDYPNYGGRGIRVCDEWRESFEAFFRDVGERPSPRHSIDRVDVNGHYKPGNVRWATRREQGRNKRQNRIMEVNGERRCLAEWCEIYGVPRAMVASRLNRGMAPLDALTAPRVLTGRHKANALRLIRSEVSPNVEPAG